MGSIPESGAITASQIQQDQAVMNYVSFLQSQVFTKCPAMLLLVSVLVAAQLDQCNEHQFDTPYFLGNSCEEIYNDNLQSRNISGYYWILDGPSRVYCGMEYTGSSCENIYNDNIATRNKSGYYRITNDEWVYCNMHMTAIAFGRGDLISSCAGVGGVWRRISGFNTTAGDSCPSPWVNGSFNNVSYCIGNTSAGCYSVNYATNGTSYHRVCGRASGYQKGSPDGFNRATIISNSYVDGISITHSSPRQHIWTYAVGVTESSNSSDTRNSNCPCATIAGRNPPSLVGSNYYCESGTTSSWDANTYYLSDVLWDGEGCSDNSTCCSDPDLPWFYHQLNMTTQDAIEVRYCMDEDFSNEAVLITNLELYIQ